MKKPGSEPPRLPLVGHAASPNHAGWRVALLALLALVFTPLFAPSFAQASPCHFRPWRAYRGIKLLRLPNGSAYIYSPIQVRIDADGAPNAYHPDDAPHLCRAHAGYKGLDCLPHAGYPDTDWWPTVLVPDPDDPDRPYVQPPSSQYAGFFVSQTTLEDTSKPRTDPARYVDSRTVPYIVFPGAFHDRKGTGTMGDLGYAINLTNGKESAFVVADTGPDNAPLGEISIALGRALGNGEPNAVNGAGSPHGRIVYIVFPDTGEYHRWPLTREKIRRLAKKLLARAGGKQAVRACEKRLR